MENGLVNLINHIPQGRYRHAVACIEGYSDFRERIARPDVEVIALRRNTVGLWRTRREIFGLCRRLRPAIVHSRNQSGLDALLPARLAGVRHAVHGEHGWDMDNLRGKRLKPMLLRRLHSPLIDRYVTVSKDLASYLVNRVGVSAKRIEQIYNGVDTERFAPAARQPRDVLPLSWAGPDAIVIGTVGRLQRVKDQSTLLRAFAALRSQRPEFVARLRLMVVGDGPLRADLLALARALDIDGVTWFAGSLDNVPDALRVMDVFVLPSLNEGISNTLLEAMATGVPVLAAAVGGNLELVTDHVNGRLFEAGRVAELTRMLHDYLQAPSLRTEHGMAARRIAVDRFGLKAMTERYTALYDSLVSGAPAQ
jgi:sugar transferase (PEP-CTERM/EpsH1 system associated)